MKDFLVVPVSESSQVGEARRAAVLLAQQAGFNETEAGKAAIIAGEAASNLAKYATGGELLLHSTERAGIAGIEILALDRGPGIPNLAEALRDGYSTTTSTGIGLGGIARLAAVFDIYSQPQVGTTLLARLWAKPLPPEFPPLPLTIGAVCRAKPGQLVNGDSWAIYQQPGRSLVMIADGLGHGPDAAQASQAAIRILREHPEVRPGVLLKAVHTALRSTRGAAVAVAEVDVAQAQVCYAGVGNIIGGIETAGGYHGLVSLHGTAGYQVHKIQEFTYPFPAKAILVMHSDGVSGRWNFDRYPGLKEKEPGLIAGVLYRDFSRRTDDMTVVVARLDD